MRGNTRMPHPSPITRAITRGRAAAFALMALMAAGGQSPSHAAEFRIVPGLIQDTEFRTVPGLTQAPAPAPVLNPHLISGEVFQIVGPRWVNSPAELVSVLQSDYTGGVMIPRDVQWDMTGYTSIPLKSGVSLEGERGHLGSRPLLFTTDKANAHSLFELTGSDVRVQGIHFRGPMADDRTDVHKYVNGISVIENPAQQLGCRVVIADNEFDQWTGGAVGVSTVYGTVLLKDYDSSWPRLEAKDADLVRIERNYIHHNAMRNGGYGVVVGGGGYATIEGNVFEFNRHDVAADGYVGGYIARFNYVMEGGFKYGDSYEQHFDVHGTGDFDGDGTRENTGWYGGDAGRYVEIAFNAIRGEQSYGFLGRQTRAAFWLRGKASIGAYFSNNVLVHDDSGEAFEFKSGGDPNLLFGSDKFNFHASGNSYDTDYSRELASGDFDGDGHTDIFVANGTSWFYSRAGSQPWEFLHASTKRTHELGFADIDNDGKTDVLYRDPSGNLGYLKSGTVALVPLTTAPVLMKELRFGDFDGDGKTDVFYTLGGQWMIWYGSTHAWTPAQSSSSSITELLFGEFDEVRGTDVAGVANGGWSISRSGLGSWTKINKKLVSSFGNAVAADFDGNGRTDIAFSDGQKWRYSRDGRSALMTMRDGDSLLPYPGLKSLCIGRFDGGTRAKVISFIRTTPAAFPVGDGFGERLVIWDGPGTDFSMRSLQNMR
jgi:hypothetical protein